MPGIYCLNSRTPVFLYTYVKFSVGQSSKGAEEILIAWSECFYDMLTYFDSCIFHQFKHILPG